MPLFYKLIRPGKMKEKNKLIRVYTGTELTVNLLKDELEKIGISSLIQNDFNSGVKTNTEPSPANSLLS